MEVERQHLFPCDQLNHVCYRGHRNTSQGKQGEKIPEDKESDWKKRTSLPHQPPPNSVTILQKHSALGMDSSSGQLIPAFGQRVPQLHSIPALLQAHSSLSVWGWKDQDFKASSYYVAQLQRRLLWKSKHPSTIQAIEKFLLLLLWWSKQIKRPESSLSSLHTFQWLLK